MFEKREYPELAGKEVIFKEKSGLVHRGVIVAVDYWIGYTIVNADDKDNYLMCARGPKAPNRESAYDDGQADLDSWDALFSLRVAQMFDGCVDAGETGSSRDNVGTTVMIFSTSCPFNQ